MIKMEDLDERRVYKIRCRNLVVGVWNPETKGFIGIREKFGSEYLFTEYHYDADPNVGTVNSAEPMDIVVPNEIPLKEGSRICAACDQESEWMHDVRADRHLNGDTSHVPTPTYSPNQALFDLLKPLSDAERDHRGKEWE